MARQEAAMGGLTDPNWGGARQGAGRKKKEGKRPSVTVSVYIPEDLRDYLLSFSSSGNASQAAVELLERARKFWPNGA